jgi:D-glycero-D-manno-heptose 1,7-bisphosphate phosphatase
MVLIDRDGVINEELAGFVTEASMLRIYPQALEALRLLHEQKFRCVIVTNQSVVGRGVITEEALARIHDYLFEKVRQAGGRIDRLYHCADAPDAATYRRKPAPGMLLEALEAFEAEPGLTPFIGDSLTDMEAAQRAGCPRYLVMTGKGRKSASALPETLRPVHLCEDLLAAARRIVASAR